jgi:4-amino-4-deoxy-L-arabinose transferase-like glycosyltransferase
MENKTEIITHLEVNAILISIAFMALYLLLANSSTLWDRDEARFSRATVEMVESGNYLVPTFNGDLRPDKPILIYWLMSLPVRLLGATEVACRFCQCTGTAITLLLVFYIGRKLFDAKAGLWAEAVLATTVLMLLVGGAAIVEGVLLPLITGAMAVFVGRLGLKLRLIDSLGIGVLMGLGALAKGPLGFMPVPVILVILWFDRRNLGDFVRGLWPITLATLLAAGIFLVWFIPVNKATNGEFGRLFFGHHVFERATSTLEGHGGRFYSYLLFYPAVIIGFFFPWTIFLPGAISATAGKRIGVAGTRTFLLSWILIPVIIMTLSATKLPHYILFAWPAMAIMTGGVIAAAGGSRRLAAGGKVLNEQDRKWLRGGIWFFIPVGLGMGAGLIAAGYFLKIDGIKLPGLICGIIILAMTIICWVSQAGENFVRSAKIIVVMIIALLAPILFGLLPAVEKIKIGPAIAKAVKEKTNKDMPTAMYKYAEPTLNLYIGRKINTLRKDYEVIEWLEQPGKRVLIIPRKEMTGVLQKASNVAFEEIASKEGINYSDGTKLDVTAIVCEKMAAK